MSILLLFLCGLFFGSFLNVVIDRVPRGEGIVVGHSHCDFCGHMLSWRDLVPLFSFLFLLGKCRYCHKFIGWKYPLIELTTGISFASILLFPFTTLPNVFLLLGILSCLIVIFYTDLFSGIIPDGALVVLFLLGILKILVGHGDMLSFFLTALGAGIFFLFIFLVTKGKGIGFGDVKYAFVMGILLGFPFIITGFYLTFLTGGAVALILIMARKKKFRQTIAFGPFLVVGTIAHIFWGQILWEFFLHTLRI